MTYFAITESKFGRKNHSCTNVVRVDMREAFDSYVSWMNARGYDTREVSESEVQEVIESGKCGSRNYGNSPKWQNKFLMPGYLVPWGVLVK